MKERKKTSSRRRFLGEASCASVGSISALSSILSLRMAGTLSADETDSDDDYKALVCVFLAGGNDSFNMITPVSNDDYASYALARGSIALPSSDFTPLPNPLADGRQLGLHKNMADLHSLYSEGNAAFICNVGTLVEPTTVAGIQAGTAKLPLGLFSHSDQQSHWQSSLPETRSPSSGWGGRMSDLIEDLNGVSGVSMNVSIAGINLFQSGQSTAIFSKTQGAIPGIINWNNPASTLVARREAVTDILEAEYGNVFERAFASRSLEAITSAEEYRVAVEAAPPASTPFSSANPLSLQLKDVAEAISVRKTLNKRRQTFFVTMGGWDHHSSLDPHPSMLQQLSEAIGEFQAEMTEMGVSDQVTLFTASDFGRTLSPNGAGSDHAWGGNQFVVGGAVRGRQVYGQYPELALGSPLDSGRGRLIPTTSVDEYFSELALWMGVSKANLPLVLPNLGRFHVLESPVAPVGFMELV